MYFIMALFATIFLCSATSQEPSDQLFTKNIPLKNIANIKESLNEEETSDRTTVIYAHGFGGCGLAGKVLYTKGNEHLLSYFYHDQTIDFNSWVFLFDKKIHNVKTFDFSDILISLGAYGSIPNPLQTSPAQGEDIKNLSKAIQSIKNDKAIGFGVSRGAATWITTLGSQLISSKICGVILESPFAHAKKLPLFLFTQNTLEAVHSLFTGLEPEANTSHFFEALFPSYNFDGIQPLQVIDAIDKNIPILFIHSKEDTIIPINHSRELYTKLIESGHKKAFLLELDHGQHAQLLFGSQGELYCNVVHAFYQLCNFPYDAERAQNIDLTMFQPSIKKIMQKMRPQIIKKKNDQEKQSLVADSSWSYSFTWQNRQQPFWTSF